MGLNIFQRAAARTYRNCAYAYIARMAASSPPVSDDEIAKAIHDTNDPAFEDAMRALASPEVTTAEAALAVLHSVRSSEQVFERERPSEMEVEGRLMGMAA